MRSGIAQRCANPSRPARAGINRSSPRRAGWIDSLGTFRAWRGTPVSRRTARACRADRLRPRPRP